MDDQNDFEALRASLLAAPQVRASHAENGLRRELAESFEKAREARSLSLRALAAKIGTSVSQVQKLLHREAGGGLTLSTVCRAAEAMDLVVTVQVHDRVPACMVVPMKWQSLSKSAQVHQLPAAAPPSATPSGAWKPAPRSSAMAQAS